MNFSFAGQACESTNLVLSYHHRQPRASKTTGAADRTRQPPRKGSQPRHAVIVRSAAKNPLAAVMVGRMRSLRGSRLLTTRAICNLALTLRKLGRFKIGTCLQWLRFFVTLVRVAEDVSRSVISSINQSLWRGAVRVRVFLVKRNLHRGEGGGRIGSTVSCASQHSTQRHTHALTVRADLERTVSVADRRLHQTSSWLVSRHTHHSRPLNAVYVPKAGEPARRARRADAVPARLATIALLCFHGIFSASQPSTNPARMPPIS